jgi:hypothetical protein
MDITASRAEPSKSSGEQVILQSFCGLGTNSPGSFLFCLAPIGMTVLEPLARKDTFQILNGKRFLSE